MITAHRLCPAKYAKNAFDGEGSRIYGGRWNPPGFGVVYTTEHLSLAMLEIIVHTDEPALLANYSRMEAEFEEQLMIDVRDFAKLPRDLQSNSSSSVLAEIGRAWLEGGQSAVLKVPSVIVPIEHNYLINPAHADFKKIRIGNPKPANFDNRLIK